MTENKSISDLSAIGNIVHDKDKDRFITTMMLSPEFREDVLCLYAFNYEIAKTSSAVSEPMLGRIRLQWWREAIEECYANKPRRHEITKPLADLLARVELPKDLFDQLIDAREKDLEEEAIQTLSELMEYANATGGNCLKLAVTALGVKAEDVMQVAGQIGTAWALIGLMRALPFHLRAKKQWLPEELVKRHKIDGRRMRDLNESLELNLAVKEICGIVSNLLQEARNNEVSIPKKVKPLLHLATLAESYVFQLKKAEYNPYDSSLAHPSGLRMFKLLWKNLLGRF
ncbi:phytoene/squalene synthase family protein [Curvivirga sp.]|uniref:phytoene/squalene synthase family protein n=1 Tax=Curvivirga sp. TaxID=2856848 RepID=UPI003B5A1C7C